MTEKNRGRPSLNIVSTTVRLPADVPERIDALEGPHKRAEFIRDATLKELTRRERAKKGD